MVSPLGGVGSEEQGHGCSEQRITRARERTWAGAPPCRVGQQDCTGPGTRKSSGGSSQPWFRKRGQEQKAKADWQSVEWDMDGLPGGFLIF